MAISDAILYKIIKDLATTKKYFLKVFCKNELCGKLLPNL